jgi:hypothetical protein
MATHKVAKKATAKKSVKRFTLKRARLAVKAAKKNGSSGKTEAAWKEGGQKWARVLGHFGATST